MSIKHPIIQNSIVFTLNAPNFSLNELGNTIVFQYGTSLDEANFIGLLQNQNVPEPGTFLMLGSGLLAASGLLRRRFNA